MNQEWPHKIETDRIGAAPLRVSIQADAGVCRDVARRLRVDSLSNLKADFVLKRAPGTLLIEVKGRVCADVSQSCVVTLAPVHSHVCEDLVAYYSDNDRAISFARAKHERQGRVADAELQILDEASDPEPATDGLIDIGELAVQYLSLGINPYPRAEGVDPVLEKAAEKAREGAAKPASRRNPFAALKDWKGGKEG